MLLSFSLLAQDGGSGKIQWTHELGFTSRQTLFIGKNDTKLFWLKKRKVDFSYAEWYKKEGEHELYIYDSQKEKTEAHKIQVDQSNYFITFKVHGERLHTFISSYDNKSNKISYWYKAYQISDMSEVVAWTLLGKTTADLVQEEPWRQNDLTAVSSEPNSQTGSIYVKVLNRFFSKGFGLVINDKGEITQKIEVETDDAFNHIRSTKPPIKGQYTKQEILTGEHDEKLVQLIEEREREKKKNSEGEHDLKSGALFVAFVDLESGSTNRVAVGEQEHSFLSSYMLTTSKGNELLLTTISILKKDNDRFKMTKTNNLGFCSLFSVSEQNGGELLDRIADVDVDRIYYEKTQFIKKTTSSRNLDNDSELVSFHIRQDWMKQYGVGSGFKIDNEGIKEFLRNQISVAVDSKKRKLTWATSLPNNHFEKREWFLSQITFKIEQISYVKNNGVNIVEGLKRFRVDAEGDLKNLQPYDLKKNEKFKEKIVPFFSHGHLERADDYLIVGCDGLDLFIGTLKK